MEERHEMKKNSSTSVDSFSTSSSETEHQTEKIICPEDEKSNTLSKKFIEELEKKKVEVEINNEREKKINIASNILFKKSEPIRDEKKTEKSSSIYPFCHLAVKSDNVPTMRTPARELSKTDFERRHITSPFVRIICI